MKYKVKKKTKFVKGDLVDFIGKRHYTTSNGKVYFSVGPGVAKVTAVSKDAKHPYHLVATENSKSKVDGWVEEKDIQGIHKTESIKPVSFENNKKVKICTAAAKDENIEIEAFDWINTGWIAVCRPKKSEKAEALAKAAETCCAKKNIEDIKMTTTVLLDICTEAASLPINGNINKNSLVNSGMFNAFTSDDYLKSADYLRRGDILLSGTNSAIVLSNGKKSKELARTVNPEEKKKNESLVGKGIGFVSASENIVVYSGADKKFAIIGSLAANTKAEALAVDINNWYRIVWVDNDLGYAYVCGDDVKYEEKPKAKKEPMEIINALGAPAEKDNEIAGSYKAVVPIHMRADAGIQAPLLAKLPKGIIVENYGYYTEIDNVKWLYVQATYKNTVYNGFVSSNCFIDN